MSPTFRPQNKCKRCQYTWHPRGKNLSLRCPNCGSSDVEIVTIPPAVLLGCGGLLILVVIAGLISSGRNREEETNTQPTHQDPPRVARQGGSFDNAPLKDRANQGRADSPRPTPKVPERSVTLPQLDSETEPRSTSQVLPVAPPPRMWLPFPVPTTGYKSEWKQVGRIEARVAGAAVNRVPIIDGNNRLSESSTAVFAVWIEVRTESKVRPVELRRWQDALGESCTLMYDSGRSIPRANLGPGASLRTGLSYRQIVPPDGTPVFEVVAFAVPDGLRDLRLSLDAERVGETGTLMFPIPATAWKK